MSGLVFPRSYLNIKFVPTVIPRGRHCYLNFADEKTGGKWSDHLSEAKYLDQWWSWDLIPDV